MARAPSIFREIVDVNPNTIRLTGNDKILIKYHSDAKATMNPFPFDGASIDLTVLFMRNGNQTAYGSEIPFSHTFRNVSSNEFVFSCLDSNGMTGTAKDTVDMIDYVKPTCYILNTTIDGDGNLYLQCQGNSFNKPFGIVTNMVKARCRYAALEGSMSYITWQEMNVTMLDSNGYIADISFEGLQYDKNYIFEVWVQDELNNITTTKVISSKPIFHWGKDDFTFEVPVNAKDIRLKSSGSNYGHYLRFGDGAYCYIAELDDDVMTIYADKGINLNTGEGEVLVNGHPILYEGASLQSEESSAPGNWTPSLLNSAISSYSTLQGWCSKVGQVVTVGFRIKATCRSGYDNTQIVITGLPYTPIYPSAGGGLISGAYVAGNYTFQCFVAETNGTITTRVQSCNNTADTNLSTSASSCNYRNGGGEVTLSGTITYLTEE